MRIYSVSNDWWRKLETGSRSEMIADVVSKIGRHAKIAQLSYNYANLCYTNILLQYQVTFYSNPKNVVQLF